ncbi:hypothetical protein PORCRE_856 [Porphyromonas crevioricanis JCM 15906]|uniref:Uncharacterized protein n=1 Tax=Porphyromonas crevioricanis JCM 15906 TaxID=1305617 RepID=T1CH53_9PORP|nr:hypothetical protein PORCRE_856 [Porphyromonas crevioricanis JCM 15906]
MPENIYRFAREASSPCSISSIGFPKKPHHLAREYSSLCPRNLIALLDKLSQLS